MLSPFRIGHEPHTADSKPVRLHADKACDIPHLRRWLWAKRIGVRIVREGIDARERLGRRRWVIERTRSRLTGYRRLDRRYERKPGNYLAFLGLAAALCCYQRLLKPTRKDTLLAAVEVGAVLRCRTATPPHSSGAAGRPQLQPAVASVGWLVHQPSPVPSRAALLSQVSGSASTA